MIVYFPQLGHGNFTAPISLTTLVLHEMHFSPFTVISGIFSSSFMSSFFFAMRLRTNEGFIKLTIQIEVSKKLGISQVVVSHFEKNALRKIKEAEETVRTARKLKRTKL